MYRSRSRLDFLTHQILIRKKTLEEIEIELAIKGSLEFDKRKRLKNGGDEGLVSSSGGGFSSSSSSCHVLGSQIPVVTSNPHDKVIFF